VRIGYADPPYLGCGKLYAAHHPNALDWDRSTAHDELVEMLEGTYDGWVIHLSATPESMACYAPIAERTGARWCSWVKGFAAFKKNVSVAYAWEPVLIKPARKPVVSKRLVMRDWIQESITLRKGLTGAKPEAVCHWAFELVGARPDDDLDDLFPGTGAVGKAWKTWQGKFTLPGSSLPALAPLGDVRQPE
jgi:hypothetical protein